MQSWLEVYVACTDVSLDEYSSLILMLFINLLLLLLSIACALYVYLCVYFICTLFWGGLISSAESNIL